MSWSHRYYRKSMLAAPLASLALTHHALLFKYFRSSASLYLQSLLVCSYHIKWRSCHCVHCGWLLYQAQDAAWHLDESSSLSTLSDWAARQNLIYWSQHCNPLPWLDHGKFCVKPSQGSSQTCGWTYWWLLQERIRPDGPTTRIDSCYQL